MERLIGWSELDLGGDAREREGCVVLVMERVESGGRGRLGSSFAGSTACVWASERAGFLAGRKTNISLLGAPGMIMG